nr:MAG TPA: hypothetical protein [Bacteriophage sp.]
MHFLLNTAFIAIFKILYASSVLMAISDFEFLFRSL